MIRPTQEESGFALVDAILYATVRLEFASPTALRRAIEHVESWREEAWDDEQGEADRTLYNAIIVWLEVRHADMSKPSTYRSGGAS